MTPDRYQDLAKRTDVDRHLNVQDRIADGPSACLLHSVIGLTGEVGELAGAVEKWIYYNQLLDSANVIEELGDCLWYISQACTALGVSMDTVMRGNIAKLKKRFPEKFDYDKVKEENRDREAEREILEDVPTDHELKQLTQTYPETTRDDAMDRSVECMQHAERLQQPLPEAMRGDAVAVGTTEALKKQAMKDRIIISSLSGVKFMILREGDTTRLHLKQGFKAEIPEGRSALVEVRVLDQSALTAPINLGYLREAHEQTGAGFAEPPEECSEDLENEDESEEAGESNELIEAARQASRDSVVYQSSALLGLKDNQIIEHRTNLNDSYNRLCSICLVNKIHKLNQVGVCPDCYAKHKGNL